MAHQTTVAVESWPKAGDRLSRVHSRRRPEYGGILSEYPHTGFPESQPFLIQLCSPQKTGKRAAGRVETVGLVLLSEVVEDVSVVVLNEIYHEISGWPRAGINEVAGAGNRRRNGSRVSRLRDDYRCTRQQRDKNAHAVQEIRLYSWHSVSFLRWICQQTGRVIGNTADSRKAEYLNFVGKVYVQKIISISGFPFWHN